MVKSLLVQEGIAKPGEPVILEAKLGFFTKRMDLRPQNERKNAPDPYFRSVYKC